MEAVRVVCSRPQEGDKGGVKLALREGPRCSHLGGGWSSTPKGEKQTGAWVHSRLTCVVWFISDLPGSTVQ